MAKRTNDLTLAAQPVAEELAQRCGSLKHVLSAGILALNDLDSDAREAYMNDAAALEFPKRSSATAEDGLIYKLRQERKKRQAHQKLVKQILAHPSMSPKIKAQILQLQQKIDEELKLSIQNQELPKVAESG